MLFRSRIALGGVAHKPWRARDAERVLAVAVDFAATNVATAGAAVAWVRSRSVQLARSGVLGLERAPAPAIGCDRCEGGWLVPTNGPVARCPSCYPGGVDHETMPAEVTECS